MDSKPEVDPANVLMYYMHPGEDWTAGTSHVINADDMRAGSVYKCVYNAAQTTESGFVHIVKGKFSFP